MKFDSLYKNVFITEQDEEICIEAIKQNYNVLLYVR